MRRSLWQFRLRSLLLLVLLSALAAAWWSHRRHCLERAEFHELQGVRDVLAGLEYQIRSIQLERVIVRTRSRHELNFFDETIPEPQRIASAIGAGYLIAPVEPLQFSDQATSNPSPLQSSKLVPEELTPTSIEINPSVEQLRLEGRAKALKDRSEFHTQQKEHYLRAIYRPCMSLKEPSPPKVPDDPILAMP